MSSLSNDNRSASLGKSRRSRAGLACHACRRSKRKCDRSLPCSTCLRYRYACQYEDHSSRIAPTNPLPVQPPAANTHTSRLAPGRSITSIPTTRPTTRRRHQAGYIAPVKNRYIPEHSSAAHSRSLGLSMGLSEAPRLHAFGYHLGIREEPKTTLQPLLTELLTWEQARALIDIYTSVIHPVFGFVDTDSLYQRSHSHWHGQIQRIQYEALLGGVIALASFFSDQLPRDVEMRVALHSKSILEDPMIGIFPCLDLVSASILRTMYVRGTTRPYVAGQSSLITINMIEAMGLHQDTNDVSYVGGQRPADNVVGGVGIRERVAIVAQSLQILFAYDFGRSIVNIVSFPSREISQNTGDFTFQQTALTNIISKSLDERASAVDLRERLVTALEELAAMPTDHDFTTLTKAELCFATYHRLRLLDPPLQETHVKIIILAGAAAIPAARRLAAQKQPWWNTIHTIFQYVCVLLSINSRPSITEVTPAIETLQILNQQFSSRITQEALNMALSLVRACIENKRQEISLLEGVTGILDQEIAPDEAIANVDLEDFLQPLNDDIFGGLSDWL